MLSSLDNVNLVGSFHNGMYAQLVGRGFYQGIMKRR